MRRSHPALCRALLGSLALAAPASAITLDGQLDAEYGPAIAVQTLSVMSNDNLFGELKRSTESELDAWRAELLTGGSGPGEYMGWTDAGPTAGLGGGSNPIGVQVALDNHNVAGVPNGCVAASGAGVSTGMEWAIPLTALGNPEGCVKLCAFTTYKGAFRMENQSLPSLPPGTCSFYTPSTFDFGAFAGAQWIEICGTSTPNAPATWGRLKALYR